MTKFIQNQINYGKNNQHAKFRFIFIKHKIPMLISNIHIFHVFFILCNNFIPLFQNNFLTKTNDFLQRRLMQHSKHCHAASPYFIYATKIGVTNVHIYAITMTMLHLRMKFCFLNI